MWGTRPRWRRRSACWAPRGLRRRPRSDIRFATSRTEPRLTALSGCERMKLKDRVAVVTGGTRGIGKAISGRLASLGAKVVVVGTNAETASQTAESLASEFGIETGSFGCDI